MPTTSRLQRDVERHRGDGADQRLPVEAGAVASSRRVGPDIHGDSLQRHRAWCAITPIAWATKVNVGDLLAVSRNPTTQTRRPCASRCGTAVAAQAVAAPSTVAEPVAPAAVAPSAPSRQPFRHAPATAPAPGHRTPRPRCKVRARAGSVHPWPRCGHRAPGGASRSRNVQAFALAVMRARPRPGPPRPSRQLSRQPAAMAPRFPDCPGEIDFAKFGRTRRTTAHQKISRPTCTCASVMIPHVCQPRRRRHHPTRRSACTNRRNRRQRQVTMLAA